jgi:hypothetical protein
MTQTSRLAYVTKDNRRVTLEQLEAEVRQNAPQTVGKHIFEQLEAIGRSEEFASSETPLSLPYSFAE